MPVLGKGLKLGPWITAGGDVPRLESPAADPGGAGRRGKFLLRFMRQNDHSQQDADDKDVPRSNVQWETCFIIKDFHSKKYCTVDFTAVYREAEGHGLPSKVSWETSAYTEMLSNCVCFLLPPSNVSALRSSLTKPKH